jgi:DNA-binding transcriptional LysR family regulator
MDFRQMRYFVAVAEELSFSRAAKRLNVSQPPLSMQIKSMEQELGASLFARTRRSVKLTHAGEVLLRHARQALEQLDRAGEMTRRAGRGEAGRLRLGFTTSVPLLDVFTTILRRFRALYPEATIEARLMSTGQQLEALAERRLDAGILRPSHWFRPSPELSVRRLWRDELHVFLPDDHPLLRKNRPIAPLELADESFITFAAHLGCGLSEHMDMLCSQAGFRPRIAQEVAAGSAILGLVAAGVGISILPECQSRSGIAGVVGRELDATNNTSDLLLAHRRRNQSPLLRNFLAVAEEVAPEMLSTRVA